MKCNQCDLLSINGHLCHETGCPNAKARWDGEGWTKQYTCFTCGYEADVGTECCATHYDDGVQS